MQETFQHPVDESPHNEEDKEIAMEVAKESFEKVFGEAFVSIEALDIPGTTVQGLEIKLSYDKARNDSPTFTELYNSNILGQDFSDLLSNYQFLSFRNLNLANYQPKVQSGLNSVGEQALHQDGMDEGFGLYHRKLEFGESARESNTYITVPEIYFPSFIHEFQTFYNNPDAAKSSELAAIIENLAQIKNSKNSMLELKRYFQPLSTARSENSVLAKCREVFKDLSEQEIYERAWIINQFTDSKTDSKTTDLNSLIVKSREHIEDHLFKYKWEEMSLLIINDRELVHGRGPKPKGSVKKNEVPIDLDDIKNFATSSN